MREFHFVISCIEGTALVNLFTCLTHGVHAITAFVSSRFTSEAANGLGHVHRHAIVHCDVKPENILLRQEGGRVIAKVADFGSAVGE